MERMNSALLLENQGLQYDNKQLNSLMKEYEQSLESIMGTFRGHAVCVSFACKKTITDGLRYSSMRFSKGN